MELYPHQVAGVEWLSTRARGILADEQGLGKTATAICAAVRVGAPRWVVLAPAVVTHNWVREISAWAPARRVHVLAGGSDRAPAGIDVLVVSHALVIRPAVHQQLRAFLGGTGALIVDEAHAFRTPNAKRTRALYGFGGASLVGAAAWCWGLTGTPAPNHPGELWAHFAGLAPERIPAKGRPATYKQFRASFCELAPSSYTPDRVRVVGARNVEDLRRRLDGFLLRRRKADHLDLPPIRWGTVSVPGTMTDELREFERKYSGLSLEALRATMLDQGEQLSRFRRLCGEAKAAAAAELLLSELVEDPKHTCVVFAHHLSVIGTLQTALQEAGIPLVRITGDVPAAARTAAVADFQSGRARVALCQIDAGGVGITLTAAHDVVFVEQSWVPGANAQAADRCHRIGQSESVLVRCLSLAGSVDELIVEALARKSAMIAAVVEGS